ncbi:sensor histidine kinase [Oceanicella actignis]|uniref:sensor histidine kinase n=1 Tax=Oceanicella actignis TaxID=1189325 RepID=UPI001254471C|nr:ATP-binding protein [Oceanicella actignis]TYO88862.1 hypothetical protein LY05_02017 [Oceanicella actignis]
MTMHKARRIRMSIPRGRRRTLAAQFALVGGVVMAAATLVAGFWVSERIEHGVLRNSANATAHYMESVISPLSQELARSDRLSEDSRRALRRIFEETPLGARVVSYKIWKPGGLVADASDPALIGRRFAPTENLREAWKGEVRADLQELRDDEDAGEKALNIPLLEIYSPIREDWSGRIIAVAEFYERSEKLAADLAAARRNSWIAVGAAMLTIFAALFGIVARGSRTIERQRAALTMRLDELAALSETNRALRRRVQEAAARSAAAGEQTLRRIGADLHDGPAQLLAFAALRLDALRRAAPAAAADIDAIESALRESIRELRAVSRGLSRPEVERLSPSEIVEAAVEAHRMRTRDAVGIDIAGDEAPALSAAARICIFRFVQEALNNAHRHAGGEGLRVELRQSPTELRLRVLDAGPGPGAAAHGRASTGLGLAGLRDRVESLGGEFFVRPRPQGGTEVAMILCAGDDR